MLLRDFIYYFGKHFFQNFVSETICIENWEGKDFDNRYLEYAQLYQKSNEKYLKLNKKELLEQFKIMKERNLNKFYDVLKGKVLNYIKGQKGKKGLADAEYELFFEELNKLMDLKKINIRFILKLRELENLILSSGRGN